MIWLFPHLAKSAMECYFLPFQRKHPMIQIQWRKSDSCFLSSRESRYFLDEWQPSPQGHFIHDYLWFLLIIARCNSTKTNPMRSQSQSAHSVVLCHTTFCMISMTSIIIVSRGTHRNTLLATNPQFKIISQMSDIGKIANILREALVLDLWMKDCVTDLWDNFRFSSWDRIVICVSTRTT